MRILHKAVWCVLQGQEALLISPGLVKGGSSTLFSSQQSGSSQYGPNAVLLRISLLYSIELP
jgi:hypothetical protein